MFRFEEPAYLYLLLLLPLLAAFYLYSNYRRRKNIRKFGDPELMAQLMPDVSKYRPDVKFWMVFVAIGLFSVLLARPQFGSKLETVKRQGVEVMIALDISNSMLAQDVQPSRLQKAKRLVAQLVDKMENDKVGMIVFAGDAFTQLPITSDYISAKMFLESIDPSLISKQGTAIGAAINLASRSFTPQEVASRLSNRAKAPYRNRPFRGMFCRSSSREQLLVTLHRPLPVMFSFLPRRSLGSSSVTCPPPSAAAIAAIRPAAPPPTTAIRL